MSWLWPIFQLTCFNFESRKPFTVYSQSWYQCALFSTLPWLVTSMPQKLTAVRWFFIGAGKDSWTSCHSLDLGLAIVLLAMAETQGWRKDGLVINTWSVVLVENGCCFKRNPNKSLLITWDPDELYNWLADYRVDEQAQRSCQINKPRWIRTMSYLFLSASSLNLVAARSNSSRKVSSALMLISSVYTQRNNARATSSCMSEKKNSSLSSVQDSVSTCSGKPAYIPPRLS